MSVPGRRARWSACAAAALALELGALAGCGAREHAAASFDPDAVPEAFTRSLAALAWPGASRAFAVLPEGDLANGEWRVRIEAASGSALAAPPRAIAFEDRWLPVAHWRRTSGDVRWDFEAVALPQGAPRDTGLLVSLEVTATNLATAPRPARLALLDEPLGTSALFRAPDGASAGGATRDWADDSPAAARGLGAAPAREGAATWTLPAHGAARARFVLATYATPGRELATWAGPPHAQRVEEARTYWTKARARGTRFELGDPVTERAVDAALVTLLVCRERRGAAWVPIGSPLQYRDVWLRDGARAIRALSVAGYTAESRELARGLERFAWPGGAILSQSGQLDGTGEALWAFAQAHLVPEPDTSVARVAELALDGVRWGERQRTTSAAPGSPLAGLLPWGDPRDAELVAAPLVGNDAWMIAGYRATAQLLRAAGRAAEAESVEAARASYVATFASALAATGSPDVPPAWTHAPRARDWGNVSAGAPCGALPVGSPRMAALATRLWAAAGGPGVGTYGAADTLHGYVLADLATWALRAGRRDAGARMLDSLLAWRSASGGIAEMWSRTGRDWGVNPPPHATAAAALVEMVRDAVIDDDGDTLRLTQGARERWWRGAHVRGAPTRWGTLDLAFARRGREARWSWRAVPVWSALTLPPGATLAAPPAAPLVGEAGGTRVLAPPGTREARVALSTTAAR